MTEREFWNIADEYEELNEDDQPYIPRGRWKELAIDIVETNNKDYDESLADLALFNYGKKLSDDIPVVCLRVVEKLCKKEEE